MELSGTPALVSGGASGLGEATARALVERGAKVAIADMNEEKGGALADDIGALFFKADVTDEDEVRDAVAGAADELGGLRFCVSCAGVGWAERVVGKNGPAQLTPFETVVRVNLIGMFNVLRFAAARINEEAPLEDGERGAVVMTASIAAFDGQIGQAAYAASKGGVVSMTLTAARDLSSRGIRVNTIAPGLFDTPLLAALPEPARQALGEQVPFPSRLGQPAEYAQLACHMAENRMLNGETVRLDGALRMAPK